MFFSVPVSSWACAWLAPSAAANARPIRYLDVIRLLLRGNVDLLRENVGEHGCDVAAKLVRILAHRKMTELFHDRDAGAPYCRCRPPRVLRRAGEIILAREEIEPAYF